MTDNCRNEERLKEIVKMSLKLKWITPTRKGLSYPEMQVSEVEKCMLAMVDDLELERMRKWFRAAGGNNPRLEEIRKCKHLGMGD